MRTAARVAGVTLRTRRRDGLCALPDHPGPQMIDDQERRDADDALWAAARERTREQVRAVFAGTVTPTRRCPHCGAETQTRYEHCPACGESYLTTPPRFSRPVRLLFAATGAVVAA